MPLPITVVFAFYVSFMDSGDAGLQSSAIAMCNSTCNVRGSRHTLHSKVASNGNVGGNNEV